MAQHALACTRAALIAANTQQEARREHVIESKVPDELQTAAGRDWLADANQIASDFGETSSDAAVQCFNWARRAQKATQTLLRLQ